LENIRTGEDYYLEIKSCTLFSGKIAMFPDAVTKRGTAHLYKLKELAASGIKTGCLFVIMNPEIKYFLPAFHIDPHFAEAFNNVRESVQLMSLSIGFDQTFTMVNQVNRAMIPFTVLEGEMKNRGAYLLIIKIDTARKVNIGALGEVFFRAGYYIYVGSAMRNLSKRLNRHLRKTKGVHWHIDYLTNVADKVRTVPIMSSDRLECEIADQLQKLAPRTVKNFGSSDCKCKSHLFYYPENPLHENSFINLIQQYRIDRLNEKIVQPYLT